MSLIKEEQQKQLKDLFKKLDNNVKLVFFTQEMECPFCSQARELIQDVSSLSDGKITLEELRVTVETMRKLVGAIEAEKPELAAKLSAEISVYEEALTNSYLLDLRSVELTANELLAAIDEINKSR